MAVGQVKRKKTDATIQKLEDALKGGHIRESACAYAGISRTTFYDRMRDDDNFRTFVEDCENYRLHIVEAQKRKLIEWGHRYAIEKELKSKAYKTYWDKSKVEHTGEDGKPIKIDNREGATFEQLEEMRQQYIKTAANKESK